MAGGNYERSLLNSAELNPAVAYAFALQVEAAFFVPLRAVRVFTKENEFEYYQEGGLNDYVHMLRKPISKPFTFQVERYVGVRKEMLGLGMIDPLALGTELILPVVLYVNRSPAGQWYNNISFTNCARAYIFTGCTVIQKEFSELNAEQSKLHSETITIAYKEMFSIDQVFSGLEGGGQWEYDGTVKGGGKAHTENRSKNTVNPMSKWNYPGTDETTKSTDHTRNRSKNVQPNMSKWNYPGTKETTPSTDHPLNRSNNKVQDPSKWNYPGTKETTTSEDHTTNRNTNKAQDPSKWNYPGTQETTKSVDHEGNRNKNTASDPSKWNYPGTDETTPSVDHTANRNTNIKPEPVLWPPNRRALKAQALSDLTNSQESNK